MVEEAEKFAEDDRGKKDKVESVNQAESLIYSTEKALAEVGDEVPADTKATVEAALTKLKEAMGSEDGARIGEASEELTKASHALAEILYKKSSPESQPEGQGPQGPPPQDGAAGPDPAADNVVDAEFEEVQDNK